MGEGGWIGGGILRKYGTTRTRDAGSRANYRRRVYSYIYGRLNVLNLRRDGLVGRDVGVTERRMYF